MGHWAERKGGLAGCGAFLTRCVASQGMLQTAVGALAHPNFGHPRVEGLAAALRLAGGRAGAGAVRPFRALVPVGGGAARPPPLRTQDGGRRRPLQPCALACLAKRLLAPPHRSERAPLPWHAGRARFLRAHACTPVHTMWGTPLKVLPGPSEGRSAASPPCRDSPRTGCGPLPHQFGQAKLPLDAAGRGVKSGRHEAS